MYFIKTKQFVKDISAQSIRARRPASAAMLVLLVATFTADIVGRIAKSYMNFPLITVCLPRPPPPPPHRHHCLFTG